MARRAVRKSFLLAMVMVVVVLTDTTLAVPAEVCTSPSSYLDYVSGLASIQSYRSCLADVSQQAPEVLFVVGSTCTEYYNRATFNVPMSGSGMNGAGESFDVTVDLVGNEESPCYLSAGQCVIESCQELSDTIISVSVSNVREVYELVPLGTGYSPNLVPYYYTQATSGAFPECGSTPDCLATVESISGFSPSLSCDSQIDSTGEVSFASVCSSDADAPASMEHGGNGACNTFCCGACSDTDVTAEPFLSIQGYRRWTFSPWGQAFVVSYTGEVLVDVQVAINGTDTIPAGTPDSVLTLSDVKLLQSQLSPDGRMRVMVTTADGSPGGEAPFLGGILVQTVYNNTSGASDGLIHQGTSNPWITLPDLFAGQGEYPGEGYVPTDTSLGGEYSWFFVPVNYAALYGSSPGQTGVTQATLTQQWNSYDSLNYCYDDNAYFSEYKQLPGLEQVTVGSTTLAAGFVPCQGTAVLNRYAADVASYYSGALTNYPSPPSLLPPGFKGNMWVDGTSFYVQADEALTGTQSKSLEILVDFTDHLFVYGDLTQYFSAFSQCVISNDNQTSSVVETQLVNEGSSNAVASLEYQCGLLQTAIHPVVLDPEEAASIVSEFLTPPLTVVPPNSSVTVPPNTPTWQSSGVDPSASLAANSVFGGAACVVTLNTSDTFVTYAVGCSLVGDMPRHRQFGTPSSGSTCPVWGLCNIFNGSPTWQSWLVLAAVIVLIVLVLAFFLASCIFCCAKRRSKKRRKQAKGKKE